MNVKREIDEDPRKAWNRGATLGEIAKNQDGTWNGARMLSALSGLDASEIEWTFSRLRELKKACIDPEECKRIVKKEAKLKPWLNTVPKSK